MQGGGWSEMGFCLWLAEIGGVYCQLRYEGFIAKSEYEGWMGRVLSGCEDTFDWLFAETIDAAFDHLPRMFFQPN